MTATNLIHRDDAVAAIVAALSADDDRTGIVHVVDDDHRSRREMYDLIARRLGSTPIAWEHPVSSPAVVTGKRVCNGRLKHELGVTLRHPLHELDA